MTTDTVTKLVGGNYILYGFKAVQSTQGGGLPLVWFGTDTYSVSTNVSWQALYQAYTSSSAIVANGRIVVGFSVDIDLGQMLNVVGGGTGTVVEGGSASAISIRNTTATPFTCGISETMAGGAKPICAFPLYGNNVDDFTPVQKLLLIFSTNQIKTGTAIDYIYSSYSLLSYSSGILIDLTGAQQRAVNYDINQGWSWGEYAWATPVPSNSNLVPFLIENGSSSAD
jgi:hypothetical protein